jgi:hypothetical protein
MEIRWARAATRHRINRERSGHVVRCPQTVIREPAPAESRGKTERIVFLGADQDGVLLEVIAVEVENALVVIHAMPMRDRYRQHVKGGDHV